MFTTPKTMLPSILVFRINSVKDEQNKISPPQHQNCFLLFSRLVFREVSVTCGGMLELTTLVPQGELTSPGYPEPYPHSLDCIWKVVAPAGKQVQLDFLDFDVEGVDEAFQWVFCKLISRVGSLEFACYFGYPPPAVCVAPHPGQAITLRPKSTNCWTVNMFPFWCGWNISGNKFDRNLLRNSHIA